MDTSNTTVKTPMIFAAIEKKVVSSIPQLTQDEVRGKEYVSYGDNNLYPQYLYDLNQSVATLKTITEGTASFVSGDDAACNVPGFEVTMNRKGDTLRNMIRWAAKDYLLYGGFSLNVIRNLNNKVAEVYYTDFRDVRTDKDNEVFYYSKDWDKKYVRSTKVLVYPKFITGADAPSSILYVKNDINNTYPIPRWSGAIKSCEIERKLDDLDLNSLENGFFGSYLINFLNGVPTDEQKAEIEENVVSKFCSADNAGRILINFANGEENAAKVEKLEVPDWGDKFKSVADRSREQIYCAFGAVPQLFGNMMASTGFNEVEFKTAWDLYSRTIVRDIQRVIGDAFDHIFGMKDSIIIKPFSINDNNNEQTVN